MSYEEKYVKNQSSLCRVLKVAMEVPYIINYTLFIQNRIIQCPHCLFDFFFLLNRRSVIPPAHLKDEKMRQMQNSLTQLNIHLANSGNGINT